MFPFYSESINSLLNRSGSVLANFMGYSWFVFGRSHLKFIGWLLNFRCDPFRAGNVIWKNCIFVLNVE